MHEIERSAVEHPLELLGLRQRAREAVEHEAVVERAALGEVLVDDPDDDVVGHELAAVDVALGLVADGRAGGDGGAEQVAGREVLDAVVLGQPRGLRALAGSLLAEQHEAGPLISA